MNAMVLHQREQRQDSGLLLLRLQEEAAEFQSPYKAKALRFLAESGMETIADIDYPARVRFARWLQTETTPSAFRHYMAAFDNLKRYALDRGMRILQDGKTARPKYENKVLFLPYHPNPDIRAMYKKAPDKERLAWDFTRDASERLKRQVFGILHYAFESDASYESRRVHLSGLREVYDFCAAEGVEDIEQLELPQIQKFMALESPLPPEKRTGVLTFCRKALFLQAGEIHWDAHVWFLERFNIQPERLDAACPVSTISFVEVEHRKNRELLKQYTRYGLGLTNLSVSVIRTEHTFIRNFLRDIPQDDDTDIRSVTPAQMEEYFSRQRERTIQAETYNKIVMSICHFFHYLRVKQYIETIPFDADCFLKKTMPKHLDRSVAQAVTEELFEKLPAFPETIRLMYLHLWGIGLRISEVCSLKGDAYYIQGEDAWIQVYQTKMRSYKRIPIPGALYRLMRVYLKKHGIRAEDYVFQNSKGGAYRSGTFRYNMLKYCRLNQIQNGEYIFKSHDYRHTIATYFYDAGVPLQSIRDYLGHDYEEMTEQYIDYMPKKIEKASEEYFGSHSLAASMKRGEGNNG